MAVAKTGSFSKAAGECYISQPALSEQIHKLESDLGKPLFDRSHRKIAPTVAGRLLMEHASRILKQIREAKILVQDSDGIASGTVALGILPTIAPYFAPHILQTFSGECPRVQVVIHEGLTAHLLEMVDGGELDFAIASLPIKENSFEVEELFTEELFLAYPIQHPLAKETKIRLEDLCSETFILMEERHCLSDQKLVFCHHRDFRPRIVMRGGQMGTILSLVNSGLGISLIPQMAKDTTMKSVVFRSLEEPRPTRTIVALWRIKRSHSKAVQEFLKHLRQAAKAYLKGS